jgi:hypothetical protein
MGGSGEIEGGPGWEIAVRALSMQDLTHDILLTLTATLAGDTKQCLYPIIRNHLFK